MFRSIVDLTSILFYTGPPKVSFTWRHWTTWSGPYREQKPTGENIEMFGSCISEVTSDLKIKNIQIFFDPTPMMFKLTGAKCPFSSWHWFSECMYNNVYRFRGFWLDKSTVTCLFFYPRLNYFLCIYYSASPVCVWSVHNSMNFCVPELHFCIYITPRYTTLECNGHVVMVKVSMKNDK